MKKYFVPPVFVVFYLMMQLKSYAILGDLKAYHFPRIGLTLNYFKDATPIVDKNFKGGWSYFYALKSSYNSSDTLLMSYLVIDTLFAGATQKIYKDDIDLFKKKLSQKKYEKEYFYIGRGKYFYFYRGAAGKSTQGEYFIYSSGKFVAIIVFLYHISEKDKIGTLHDNILNSFEEKTPIVTLPKQLVSFPLPGRLMYSMEDKNARNVYINDMYRGDTYDHNLQVEVMQFTSSEVIFSELNTYHLELIAGKNEKKLIKFKDYASLVKDYYWIEKFHNTSAGFEYVIKSGNDYFYASEFYLTVPNTWQLLACRIFLKYPNNVTPDEMGNRPPDDFFTKDIMHTVVKYITVLPPQTKPDAKTVNLSEGFCAGCSETFFDRLNAIIRASQDEFSSIRGAGYPVVDNYYPAYYSYIPLDSLSKSYIKKNIYDNVYEIEVDYGHYLNGREEAERFFESMRNKLKKYTGYPFGAATFKDYSSMPNDAQFYVYPDNKGHAFGKYYLWLYMNEDSVYEYGKLVKRYRNRLLIRSYK